MGAFYLPKFIRIYRDVFIFLPKKNNYLDKRPIIYYIVGQSLMDEFVRNIV